jgi:cellulose synthase/poly-beta-1,6-N-acetylglucosamine synthase-like glycosyltransferase
MIAGVLLAVATWVAWALALYVLLISIYTAAIVVGAWFYGVPRRSAATQLRFVVIVPAHNEQEGVASTVSQLLGSKYEAGAVRVLVVADNCTDDTAARATAAGATVLARNDPVNRGKGQALNWVLTEHAHMFAGSDLLAFVDADMNVDADFFAAMAEAFADPKVFAAQGRYVISNPSAGLLPAVGFASFCYVNHVRPAGRCFWGGSADLKGSGMVFRRDFLLARGWSAHSIAEDVQLGKELLLEGVRVVYVPGAKVDSDIPSTLAQVRVQQSRWEGGKKQIFSTLLPRTVVAAACKPSVNLLDGVIDLLVPPLTVVVAINLVGIGLSLVSGGLPIGVFVFSLACFASAVLTGLVQNRASAATYGLLVGAPLFMLWKLVLLSRLAVSPTPTAWNRTPRDRK